MIAPSPPPSRFFSTTLLSLLLLLCSSSFVESFGIGGGLKSTTPPKKIDTSSSVSSKGSKSLPFGPKIEILESKEDYINFIHQDERLCVIKFYASWCKSCQKFGILFKRLASQQGDIVDHTTGELLKGGTIRFAEMEFGANAEFCRSLGIKKLPNIHIYKVPSPGWITGFPCGPSKFTMLEETLDRLQSMDEIQLAKTLEEGSDMADEIVKELYIKYERTRGETKAHSNE